VQSHGELSQSAQAAMRDGLTISDLHARIEAVGVAMFGWNAVGRIVEVAPCAGPTDIVQKGEQRLSVARASRIDREELAQDGEVVVVSVDDPGIGGAEARQGFEARQADMADATVAVRPIKKSAFGAGLMLVSMPPAAAQ
jgi:hypothetical protein